MAEINRSSRRFSNLLYEEGGFLLPDGAEGLNPFVAQQLQDEVALRLAPVLAVGREHHVLAVVQDLLVSLVPRPAKY